MSFPSNDTIWGQIDYNNKKYDLLDRPLSNEIWDKINLYKKENMCGVSSASWSSNKFEWIIEDNNLYISSLKCRLCKNKDNLIPAIFKVDKLQALWVNEDMRLVLSKNELGLNNKGKMIIERELLVLAFKKGILISSSKEIEKYTSKSLKYYLR